MSGEIHVLRDTNLDLQTGLTAESGRAAGLQLELTVVTQEKNELT